MARRPAMHLNLWARGGQERPPRCEPKAATRLALPFCALLALLAVGSTPVPAESGGYPIATAEAGQWHPERQAEGRVRASREEVFTAPFPLYVKAVLVAQGQEVKAGATLADVEAPELSALLEELAEALRQASLATDRLQDAKRRFETRFATRRALLQAETASSEARAHVDRALQAAQGALLSLGHAPSRTALVEGLESGSPGALARSYATVRARVPGRVAEVFATAGTQASQGDKLLQLEDVSRVYVDVEVPRSEAADWERGRPVLVLAPGKTQPLALASPTPSLDTSTGLAVLRYDAANEGRTLLDGQWVAVRLFGRGRPVAWVPESAVVARENQTYCIVERAGKYTAVPVEAGPARQGKIPILGGLSAGARVVTEGAYELLYRDLNELMQPAD
jgi:multidrug efflux pump subunit AcrA (membrane-fusion protein)